MKKIYSYLFATVAIIACVACVKETALDFNTPSHEIPEDAIFKTFYVSVSSDDVKSQLSETISLWSGTENIAVLGSYYYNFTAQLDTPSAEAEFSCDAYSASEREVMAVYPYASDYTVDLPNKSVANVVLPTIQYSPEGSYDPKAHIAVAHSTDGKTLQFKNAVSLFKFTVGMTELSKVCIYIPSTSKASVVGTGTLSYNEGNPTFTATSSVKYVDVLPSTGTTFANGKTYYIAVMPGSYPDGFTFEITTKTGNHDYLKTIKAQTLEPNKIYDLGTIAEPTVTIVGDFNNWAIGANPATLQNSYYVAKNVAVTKSSSFKILMDNTYYRMINGAPTKSKWQSLYQIEGNPTLASGTYDIYISKDNYSVCYVNAGTTMPTYTTQTNREHYIVMQHNWSDWDYRLYVWGGNQWGSTNTWPGIYAEGSFVPTNEQTHEYKYWKVDSSKNGKSINFLFTDDKTDGNIQQTKDWSNLTLNSDRFFQMDSWDSSAGKANIKELDRTSFR